MIVERITFKTKHGCRDKFIELVKAVVAEAGLTPHVYSFRHGLWNAVISDLVFETEEDRQKFSWDWSKPIAAEWGKKTADLIDSDITNELLELH